MDSHVNSALLYDTLEMVGLSEDVRLLRRKLALLKEIIATARHLVTKNKTAETYYFGSVSEGTTVYGMDSDIDILNCSRDVSIFLKKMTENINVSFNVVMDSESNPGYVKIQLLYSGIPLTPEQIKDLLPDRDGRWCLTNFLPKGDIIRHGPAFRTSEGTSDYDRLGALKWTDSPDTFKQWLAPARQHTWPDDVLERCRVLPLLLVPVGHPFSTERKVEWRISYSFHERELMFSLNPAQHKCYVTLKMMKKEILDPKVGEDCISSYHLKTCLFWAIEHTQNALWTRDCLLDCVSICLWYLMYFVLTGNCPNYFLPEVNLFQRLYFSQVKCSLLAELKTVITNLIFFIKLLRCADVGMCFANGMCFSDQMQSSKKILTEVYCHFILIGEWVLWNRTIIQHACCMCESREEIIESLNDILNKLCCSNLDGEHTESLKSEAIAIMIPRVKFLRDVCIAAKAISAKEDFDGHLTHLNELATVSGHDLLTPRLMIVTLLYKLERFVECENVLRQIDKDLPAYVLSFCACKDQLNRVYPMDGKLLLATSPDAMAMLALATATCISFVPADRDLVPEPLLEAMDRYRHRKADEAIPEDPFQDDCLRVDGKVYFYLMKYLIYSHLNKPTERCLNDMRTLIDTDLNLRHTCEANNVYDWMNDNEY